MRDRADVARAVLDVYDPLRRHRSPGGARVHLGSFAAVFDEAAADLEGFARPLHGIVPLAVGGHDFPHWDLIVAGLDAGSDPDSPEYWGAVPGDGDQRMVEQAAIGLALAFCPEHTWDELDGRARDRLATWLLGVFEHEPHPNNWQFFRVLVGLGLERVGVATDGSKTKASLDVLDRYRVGEHWYVDGDLGHVDYYVPWAFHTYGLVYAAANDAGLGDDGRAERFRERAAGFSSDFQHWFAPDGAAVPMGRSLTYRFAMAAFWGALAWADVEPAIGWSAAKGLYLRHLRWWTDKAISDRDGVLSVGFTYDNRRLCESYSSAGSPYWAMKGFAGVAAAAGHPFWSSDEAPLGPLVAPATITDAGWVVARDEDQAVALVGRTQHALDYPEQASAKYRKLAYSSAFGFSGDLPDIYGRVATDSMLALTDAEGNRRNRLGVEAAGVEDAMAWSTWWPWPDVRVDTVCWVVDAARHGRLHRIRTERPLTGVESGFAIGAPTPEDLGSAAVATADGCAVIATREGCSAIVDLSGGRHPSSWPLAVNSNLLHPRVAVPVLRGELAAGDHRLACSVFASPAAHEVPDDGHGVPGGAEALLERIGSAER
jgi:hypothetical protein